MAKTTITQVTDDLDGSVNAETYRFSWQGTDYEIDLSNKNFKALDKALQPYIKVATKVARGTGRNTSSRRRSSSSSRTGSRRDLSEVRAWARGQGIEVSDRGRVSRSVVEQYDAAH